MSEKDCGNQEDRSAVSIVIRTIDNNNATVGHLHRELRTAQTHRFFASHRESLDLQIFSSGALSMAWISNQLQQITAHSAVRGGSCVIKGETIRAGLACIIEGKCLKCSTTLTIPSSSRITTSTTKKFWTVNVGAVLGQMATGGVAWWGQWGLPLCQSKHLHREVYNRGSWTTVVKGYAWGRQRGMKKCWR